MCLRLTWLAFIWTVADSPCLVSGMSKLKQGMLGPGKFPSGFPLLSFVLLPVNTFFFSLPSIEIVCLMDSLACHRCLLSSAIYVVNDFLFCNNNESHSHVWMGRNEHLFKNKWHLSLGHLVVSGVRNPFTRITIPHDHHDAIKQTNCPWSWNKLSTYVLSWSRKASLFFTTITWKCALADI